MIRINFYLKSKTAKGLTPVNLVANAAQFKRFRTTTFQQTVPSSWDFKRQKSKTNAELNKYLERMREEAEKAYYKNLAEGKTDYEAAIKVAVRRVIGKPGDNELAEAIREFTNTKVVFQTESTMKKYKTTFQHLGDFIEVLKREPSFSLFTLPFFERWNEWLISDRKLINATASKYMKITRQFLAWAMERGFHNNMEFKRVKIKTYETDSIYLTENELMSIYRKEFTTPGLNDARDIFCFECFTGLRFSDTQNLRPENIKNGYLSLRTVKGKQLLIVPLSDLALEILKRHNYKLPKLSNSQVNSMLKDIGQLAELKEPIIKSHQQGSKIISETFKKYELLSTHTGRRTFITLSLEKGIRPEVVMAITGHKSYASFKKYIKLTDKVLHVEMNRAWNSKTKVVELKAQ